jgi:hypothetical protein
MRSKSNMHGGIDITRAWYLRRLGSELWIDDIGE